MRTFLHAFLRYTRSDRRAVIIIGCLSCLLLGWACWKCLNVEESVIRKDRLTGFNPNKVDSLQLLDYGLPQEAVNSWMSLCAGGKTLRTKEDLMELKGLTDADITVLEPFIQFPRNRYHKRNKQKDPSGSGEKTSRAKKKKKR